MSKHSAGEEVEYAVTFLAMEERPRHPRPPLPAGSPCALIAAKSPPNWYFLSLYEAVGRDYEWTDQIERPDDELAAWLNDENVVLYTFLRAGWPHGFFVLDHRETETCDLAYFGLVPEAMGRGLGWFLLETAVHMAWDLPGVERVTVNTNSLDHPRALPLYQKAGFAPYRRATRRRIL
ncbi:GNAT family N-acetyltransferase, partial [Amaricoccus macauensis]|uniref:GNAT family N-acetyltransferase n=1 Tax=Amaricoccus macauensis TaxID=57001 RepID=UPI003C7ABAD0